jgi:hypothetical protein
MKMRTLNFIRKRFEPSLCEQYLNISLCLKQNTTLNYKVIWLMLFKEIIYDYCKNHWKALNILREKNVEAGSKL